MCMGEIDRIVEQYNFVKTNPEAKTQLEGHKSTVMSCLVLNGVLFVLLNISFVINCFTLGKPLRRPLKFSEEEMRKIQEAD